MRSNIFGGDGYLVAYPSIGGIVFLKDPLAVDLQYLGLPNTHDTARVPDEDDEFAAPMVKLGAQWSQIGVYTSDNRAKIIPEFSTTITSPQK